LLSLSRQKDVAGRHKALHDGVGRSPGATP
jgi:hypothetical protein